MLCCSDPRVLCRAAQNHSAPILLCANCWNVAVGDFGGGNLFASSNAEGDLCFFSADGKRKTKQHFDYIASIEAVPDPPAECDLAAINEPAPDREELVLLQASGFRTRVPIGRNRAVGPVGWRYRRLVTGRFVKGSPEVAVLRGDGSVVVVDRYGRPAGFVPSVASRVAIELGPPENGRDTLLSCEDRALERFRFPIISAEAARALTAALATVKNPCEQFLVIRDQDSADELSVRAAWVSLSGGTSMEAAKLFTAALSRAKHKAPIYVSFGDTTTGVTSWIEGLNGAMETMVGQLAQGLSSQQGQLARKAGAGGNGQMDALNKVFTDSFRKGAARVGAKFLAGQKAANNEAVVCYLAAVAEDPACNVAWQRLAVASTGDLRARAVAEFIKHDPENALPYYLRASFEVDRKDLAAALKSVQQGNAKAVCRMYRGPRPNARGLRYVDDETNRRLGVVGEPVSNAYFHYMLDCNESFQWQPLIHELRNVFFKLEEESKRLQQAGKTEAVASLFEAMSRMGIHLMKVEPRHSLTTMSGYAFVADAYKPLKRAYETLGNQDALNQLDLRRQRARRCVDELHKTLRVDLKDADLRAIMQGKADPVAEESASLERALLKSAL
jgi:hypothetical protein